MDKPARDQTFPEPERAGLYKAIYLRRDIRHFRPDPLPDETLARLLLAAHHAGSVGFMQPWNFLIIRNQETKARLKAMAEKERLATAASFGEPRASSFLALKVEGLVEAPVVVCVTCDPSRGGPHVLGRHSDPATDVYSAAAAIQNLWLAARAEGVGVGWVTFYQPAELHLALGIPPHVRPIGLLCLGYPEAFPPEPTLQTVGWRHRLPLEELVYLEGWGRQGGSAWDNLCQHLDHARDEAARHGLRETPGLPSQDASHPAGR